MLWPPLGHLLCLHRVSHWPGHSLRHPLCGRRSAAGMRSVAGQWTGDRGCKDLVHDVADHVLHPLLPPKMVQRRRHVILVPAPLHKAHIIALHTPVPAAICIHGHGHVAACEETEHEAAGGAASVLPLPTVNEDRGPEKDSDEDHLHGVFQALHPGAPIMPSTPRHPQPLANAIRVPGVIPQDMGQRTRQQEMRQKTARPPARGLMTRATGRGHPWGRVFGR